MMRLIYMLLPLALFTATGSAQGSGDVQEVHAKRLKINDIVNQHMQTNFSVEEQINLSGRQRMLAQKISALALSIYLDIDRKTNTKLLVGATKEFANSLKKLKQSSLSDKNIMGKIISIESEWNEYIHNIKELLFKGNREKEGLRFVIENDEKLVEKSDDLVKAYRASKHSSVYLDKSTVALIDMAGRQRMLTLKMLKEKMLIVSGDDKYKSELQKTSELFDKSLNIMMTGDKTISPPVNEITKQILKETKSHWQSFKKLLNTKTMSKNELKQVISESYILLNKSDKLVKRITSTTEY